MRYLTFALAKGRLAKKTLAMFEQMGITCEEAKDPDTRKLIFTFYHTLSIINTIYSKIFK